MKVVVGISGGVDSAITAWYLQKAGMHVIGCYVETKDDPEERERAYDICSFLGIVCRHVVKKDAMKNQIILPMIRAYAGGSTPNPCIHCNAKVKFPALLELLKEEKADKAATGHYVRKRGSAKGFVLRRGKDPEKDQSYMLSLLPRHMLDKLLFPLGDFHKTVIRGLGANVFGDLFSSIPESQDLCFMKGENLQIYIEKNVSSEKACSGPILSHSGKILGKHKGLFHYTIGQRKGLGLSGGPWFVYDICETANTLRVGPKNFLGVNKILCSQVNWFISPESLKDVSLCAKVRYRGASAEVKSFSFGEGLLQVETVADLQGVAPGQGLVLYAKDLMVCGAIIQETERRS